MPFGTSLYFQNCSLSLCSVIQDPCGLDNLTFAFCLLSSEKVGGIFFCKKNKITTFIMLHAVSIVEKYASQFLQ